MHEFHNKISFLEQSDCGLENLSGLLGDLKMHFLFWGFMILLTKLMDIFSSFSMNEKVHPNISRLWYFQSLITDNFETLIICFGLPLVETNSIILEKK